MFLEKLYLSNFKNYEEANFTFSSQVNCIVGENGSGKTNLLDAVYFLALSKSAMRGVLSGGFKIQTVTCLGCFPVNCS